MKQKILNFIKECQEFADEYAKDKSIFESSDFDTTVKLILVRYYIRIKYFKILYIFLFFRITRKNVRSCTKKRRAWKQFRVAMKWPLLILNSLKLLKKN